MKYIMPLLFIVSVLVAQDSNPTATPVEPYHIKSDILGEPISAYRQNNPDCTEKNQITGMPNFYHVQHSEKLSGDCMTIEETTSITYANVPMKAKQVTFSEDRFVFLMYIARHSGYESLRDNLTAKFGEPTRKATEELQNRMGAHFTGENLVWDNGISSIHLEEYGGNLDTTTLTFALDDYLKWQERLQKESAKKPSSDM